VRFTPPAGVDLADTPDRRSAKFVKQLSAHIQQKHPQYFAAAALQGQEYGGMLMLRYFSITSGDVLVSLDKTRWKIHQATRAVIVSDDRIRQRVAEMLAGDHTNEELEKAFAEPGGIGSRIVALLQKMRDNITENGRY
jgi:hypothetical protein